MHTWFRTNQGPVIMMQKRKNQNDYCSAGEIHLKFDVPCKKMEFVDKNILKRIYIINYYIYYTGFRVSGVEEPEFCITFYVRPISDVLKIELCRFHGIFSG